MERFSQSFIKINYDKKIRLILIRISLIIHAADRNRTGTGITTHGILSPGRLPVPPLRPVILFKKQKMGPTGLEPVTLCL